MSIQSALQPPARPALLLRWRARSAVWLAHLLALLPPRRIRGLLVRLRAGARPADYATAKQARDAVLSVSLAMLNTKGCLPRSLATTLLCRMRGTWPAWCVGISPHPPIAIHAWVEADGLPVDEGFPAGHYHKLIEV